MSTDLRGRVAVITGGASGIGYAIAAEALRHGMRIVLSDVEAEALAAAARALGDAGEVTPVRADVSDLESVAALVHATESAYGPAWLVVNNAGVSVRGRVWELRHADWEWVVGVNFWGVVHGIETFLPAMVERDAGYIVNTASMAGLVVAPRTGAAYGATKHAIVGLSESLYRELEADGSAVGVSVLCPGPVVTNIATSARNRPGHLGDLPPTNMAQHHTSEMPGRMEPAEVGARVFDAIDERRFWVLPHASMYAGAITARASQICAEENPNQESVDWVLASVDAPPGH